MVEFSLKSTLQFSRLFLCSIFAFLLVWMTAGCSTYHFNGIPEQGFVNPYDPHRVSFFESKREIAFKPIPSGAQTSYRLWTLPLQPEVKLPHEGDTLSLSYYLPIEPQGIFPAIILLPITSGDYFTENLAEYFVRKGFAVLRYPSRNELGVLAYEGEGLNQFRDVIRNDVVNVRQGIAWLKKQKEVDPSRIGVMGISLGAIVASLIVSMEPDLQGAVLFLAGGNLPGILKTSAEDPIVAFREKEIIGENEKQKRFLRENLFLEAKEVLRQVEPLAYPSLLSPERILMINGYFDDVIKRSYTKELWKHLGKPTLISLPTGHYGSILYFYYARYKANQHFSKILK